MTHHEGTLKNNDTYADVIPYGSSSRFTVCLRAVHTRVCKIDPLMAFTTSYLANEESGARSDSTEAARDGRAEASALKRHA